MASKDKIFLDTNVALDHLADRQPFAEYAHRLFALAETGELIACLSSLSFSNLYYILRKLKGHDDALVLLRKLKLLVRVAAVTNVEVESALSASSRTSRTRSNISRRRRKKVSARFSHGIRPTTP
jgi:predicted nucleic acid-binding protein